MVGPAIVNYKAAGGAPLKPGKDFFVGFDGFCYRKPEFADKDTESQLRGPAIPKTPAPNQIPPPVGNGASGAPPVAARARTDLVHIDPSGRGRGHHGLVREKLATHDPDVGYVAPPHRQGYAYQARRDPLPPSRHGPDRPPFGLDGHPDMEHANDGSLFLGEKGRKHLDPQGKTIRVKRGGYGNGPVPWGARDGDMVGWLVGSPHRVAYQNPATKGKMSGVPVRAAAQLSSSRREDGSSWDRFGDSSPRRIKA